MCVEEVQAHTVLGAEETERERNPKVHKDEHRASKPPVLGGDRG